MVGYAGAASQPAPNDQSNAIFDLISQIARSQPGGIRALAAGEAPGVVPDGPVGMAPGRVPSVDQLAVPQQFNPGFQPPPAQPMQQQPVPEDPAMGAGGPGAPDLARMLQSAAGGGGYPGGAPAPDAGGGGMGMISDALSALGGIDTDRGPLAAFGSGFAGARGNRQRREDRKMALANAADEKAYQRGRDKVGDDRYAAAAAYQHGRDATGDQFKQQALTIQEKKAMLQSVGGTSAMRELRQINEERTAHGEEPLPLEDFIRSKSGYGGGGDAETIAQAIANGDQPPVLTGLYRLAGPVRASLEKQGYNLTKATQDWDATKKLLATMNGAQQTRLRQAVGQVKEALPLVQDLADKWDAGGYPTLNKAQLVLAKEGAFGPDAQSIATQLEAEIADVTSELGTVYKGGNSSTDESLRLAATQLNASWSNKTLKDAIELARKNITYRENSLRLGTAGIENSTYNQTQPTQEINPQPDAAVTDPNAPALAPASAASPPAPATGSIEDGYRFQGGDPADPQNWVPVL